jgi:hypothetical protein
LSIWKIPITPFRAQQNPANKEKADEFQSPGAPVWIIEKKVKKPSS